MTTPITEEERRNLKASFDLFDDSNTGSVLASNIGTIIRACGENPTEAHIEELVKRANEKDGTISFQRFLEIIRETRAKEKRLTVSDLEGAFKVFDTANSGSIHRDELRKVLTTLGEKLSQEEVDELLLMAQPNSDGLINYSELAKKLIP